MQEETKEIPTNLKFTQIAQKYESFLFDCDGVFYKGENQIEGSFNVLRYLRKYHPHKRVFFLTNNPTYSREDFVKVKLAKLAPDIEASPQEVLAASYLLPKYVKMKYPTIKNVLIIGKEGLKDEFKVQGFQVNSNTFNPSITQFSIPQFDQLDVGDLNPETKLDAVAVSLDFHFNFYRLAFASLAIQKGAKFFASNPDKYTQMKNGKLPGGGTIAAAVAMATSTQPQIPGKPNTFACELIEKEYGLDRKGMIMIGDNLNTDIQFAKNCGIASLLVLTGVTSQEQYMSQSEIKADYCFSSLGELIEEA